MASTMASHAPSQLGRHIFKQHMVLSDQEQRALQANDATVAGQRSGLRSVSLAGLRLVAQRVHSLPRVRSKKRR